VKALELTVYPMTCNHFGEVKYQAAHDGLHLEQIDELGEHKRLSDAELAAEYYAQDSRRRHEQWIEAVRGDEDYEGWERAAQSRMYEHLTMLHRFATLPHYDEATK